MRRLAGDIFAKILSHMKRTGEAALAKSLWHCVRQYQIMAESDGGFSFYDLVNFIDGEDVPPHLAPVLLPDGGDAGTFFQLWVVDRVMRDGCLWSGHYVKPTIYKTFEWGKSQKPVLGLDRTWASRWINDDTLHLNLQIKTFKAEHKFWTSARDVQGPPTPAGGEKTQIAGVTLLSPPEWTIEAEEGQSEMVSALTLTSHVWYSRHMVAP